MRPTLRAGDRLLLVAVPGPPRVGWLALARDPRSDDRELLKRVYAIGPDGVDLRGDHPAASTDSRVFGRVASSAVRTYRAWRYAPAGRAGRVPAVAVSSSRAPGGRPRSRSPDRR